MRERELVENERERGRAIARNGEVSDVDRGIVVAEKRYRPPLLPLFVLKNEKGRKVAHRSRPLAARGRITVGKIKRKTREKKKREISGRDL